MTIGGSRPRRIARNGNGNGSFGLTPMPGGDGTTAPYFALTAAAGHAVSASAFISNRGRTAEKLEMSRSTGYTADNGDSAFSQAFIVEQVVVAVAITVGSPSALTTQLAIPGVSATLEGTTVRLNIGLENTGQTVPAAPARPPAPPAASVTATPSRRAASFTRGRAPTRSSPLRAESRRGRSR